MSQACFRRPFMTFWLSCFTSRSTNGSASSNACLIAISGRMALSRLPNRSVDTPERVCIFRRKNRRREPPRVLCRCGRDRTRPFQCRPVGHRSSAFAVGVLRGGCRKETRTRPYSSRASSSLTRWRSCGAAKHAGQLSEMTGSLLSSANCAIIFSRTYLCDILVITPY